MSEPWKMTDEQSHAVKREAWKLIDEGTNAIDVPSMFDASVYAAVRLGIVAPVPAEADEPNEKLRETYARYQREAEVFAVGDAIAEDANRDDRPAWCYDTARVAIAALENHRAALRSTPTDDAEAKS